MKKPSFITTLIFRKKRKRKPIDQTRHLKEVHISGCQPCNHHPVPDRDPEPKRVPLELGDQIVMIDEEMAPLIRRLNGPIGVCTMGSHQAWNSLPARFYFKCEKYKELMDFLFRQFDDTMTDPSQSSARYRAQEKLINFIENKDKFDARPMWWRFKDRHVETVIYVTMNQSDVPVLCELWDAFWDSDVRL